MRQYRYVLFTYFTVVLAGTALRRRAGRCLVAGSRTSTRAPAGHSSVREGATRTTSLGSRVAYLKADAAIESASTVWAPQICNTADLHTQNCRGVKTDDRLTMLFDGLERRGAFAAFVQETWRVGEEAYEQQVRKEPEIAE